MPTTDEELQQKKDKVEGLRQQVADEAAKSEVHTRSLENDITGAQLDVEAVRLETQLAELKETGSSKAAKEGAAAPLQAAKEQMAVAVAQQKAADKAAAHVASSDSNK